MSGGLILPPEIWLYVAEYLVAKSPRPLINLCKAFPRLYSVCVCALYAHITLASVEVIPETTFNTLLLSPHLRFTKHLTVNCSLKEVWGDRALTHYYPSLEGVLYKEVNSRLRKLLNAVPNLESFSVLDPRGVHDQRYRAIPIFNKTLEVIRHRIPKLRNLHIQINDLKLLRRYGIEVLGFKKLVHGPYEQNGFNGFRQLTSLRILGITGKASEWVNGLTDTILKSPSLSDLALALPEPGPRNDEHHILYNLCSEYAWSNGPQLSIKSFHIDEWQLMHARLQEQLTGYKYLSLLTDIGKLQYIHIHTNRIASIVAPSQNVIDPVYDPFRNANAFSSLRRFSAEFLSKKVFGLIQAVGHDLTAPNFYLSEILFDYIDGDVISKLGSMVDPGKATIWPELFFLRMHERLLVPNGYYGMQGQIMSALCTWTGLRRLHLTYDFRNNWDRARVLRLLNKNNLEQLVISRIPSKATFLLWDPLDFTVASNLEYVGLDDSYFRFRRNLSQVQIEKFQYEDIFEIELFALSLGPITENAEMYRTARSPFGRRFPPVFGDW